MEKNEILGGHRVIKSISVSENGEQPKVTN